MVVVSPRAVPGGPRGDRNLYGLPRRRPAPPLSCKSAKLLGRGSLSHSAQNEKEETVRNEIALMLLRIRKNGLFSVKTQSNRYFGWLFNHQTPFPHAAGEARVETKRQRGIRGFDGFSPQCFSGVF